MNRRWQFLTLMCLAAIAGCTGPSVQTPVSKATEWREARHREADAIRRREKERNEEILAEGRRIHAEAPPRSPARQALQRAYTRHLQEERDFLIGYSSVYEARNDEAAFEAEWKWESLQVGWRQCTQPRGAATVQIEDLEKELVDGGTKEQQDTIARLKVLAEEDAKVRQAEYQEYCRTAWERAKRETEWQNTVGRFWQATGQDARH